MRRQGRDTQGKLKALAQQWASGRSKSSDDSDFAKECRAFGIDPAALDWKEVRPADKIRIWPDMVDSVALFFALATQWIWASGGMAGAWRVGINYQAIEPTAQLSGLSVTPTVFEDIRTLEQEALSVWNRKR